MSENYRALFAKKDLVLCYNNLDVLSEWERNFITDIFDSIEVNQYVSYDDLTTKQFNTLQIIAQDIRKRYET